LAGLVLALPMIAIIKVLLDSVDSLKPYGFLLGEAEIPPPPINSLEEVIEELSERIEEIGQVDEKE
ncbi:MAG: AI-2E family transporter, partial [Spirosoma sp.]|nr:AI-2E family transporter [Spirosoma sp.]